MAATNFTPISLYYSTTASAVPLAGNLVAGELALNTVDEKLYFKNSAGTVKLLAANITPAPNGGTGQSSYAVGDLLYASTTTALSKLADVATGNALISGGVGVAPSYGKIGLTTHVSGTLAVGNGGTGATTLTANNVLLGNGTSALQVVAPGTAGNVLTSNGTTWTSAAGATVSAATPTALGTVYGKVDTTNSNFGFGQNTLASGSLSGTNNTAVGKDALNANTTGTSNTAVGSVALQNNTTGSNNSAFGWYAMILNTTGGSNTASGVFSMYSNTTGSSNTAYGYQSLYTNTVNGNNTAIGRSALQNSDAADNTALGHSAGLAVTSGQQNTLIGRAAGNSGTNNLTTGSNNILLGYNSEASSATVSNEVTIGNTSITSTRLRGVVEHNMAIFEQATISATAATGTIAYYARSQSVLYYTSNASANWTVNLTGASGVTLNSIMQTGQSMTVAFLVTQGSTAYYNSAVQVDGSSVTPKWQGGTAPSAGNASSVDTYVYTVIKTGSAAFTVLASQTKFA